MTVFRNFVVETMPIRDCENVSVCVSFLVFSFEIINCNLSFRIENNTIKKSKHPLCGKFELKI